jgi:TolA-binding protein
VKSKFFFTKTMQGLFAVIFLFITVGCLQTRSALRDQTGQAPKVTAQQQKAAEAAIQQENTDKEFREMYGRIESVENQIKLLSDGEKTKVLETRMAQMETEMNLLRATLSELNAKAKKEAQMLSSDQRANIEKKSPPSALQEATKHFEDKKWEDAILAYEEYRKSNPKGKEYAEATLKIGLCFQNMGLKDDAKVFFKEVVDKYPKTKEADAAKTKLKKL